jgi:hypothetical protein
MTSHESPRFFHRLLTALGGGLKRQLLGKSTHEYMKQFSGSDAYWDRVTAAQLGWSRRINHDKAASNTEPNGAK